MRAGGRVGGIPLGNHPPNNDTVRANDFWPRIKCWTDKFGFKFELQCWTASFGHCAFKVERGVHPLRVGRYTSMWGDTPSSTPHPGPEPNRKSCSMSQQPWGRRTPQSAAMASTPTPPAAEGAWPGSESSMGSGPPALWPGWWRLTGVPRGCSTRGMGAWLGVLCFHRCPQYVDEVCT